VPTGKAEPLGKPEVCTGNDPEQSPIVVTAKFTTSVHSPEARAKESGPGNESSQTTFRETGLTGSGPKVGWAAKLLTLPKKSKPTTKPERRSKKIFFIKNWIEGMC